MTASETVDPSALEEVAFARRDRLALEVEVLRLEEMLRPPFNRKTTAPTRSRFHTLLLVDGGISFHHVDFERYSVSAGDLFIIPEGCVHAFDRAREIQGYMALFTGDFLDRCIFSVWGLSESSQMLLRVGAHLRLGESSLAQVQDNFETLANYTSPPSAQRFASEAITSAFSLLVFTIAGLTETAAAVNAQSTDDELVARFLDLLEARFRSRHQASSYARTLGVSLRTLDRHLIATKGLTTRQAISARLVLESKRLLTKKDLPIKNIAYELGFSEPQNFTRFLRAKTGLSPQAFRESLDR